jgi:hypothetical protein
MFYSKVIKICPNYAKIIEFFQLMHAKLVMFSSTVAKTTMLCPIMPIYEVLPELCQTY